MSKNFFLQAFSKNIFNKKYKKKKKKKKKSQGKMYRTKNFSYLLLRNCRLLLSKIISGKRTGHLAVHPLNLVILRIGPSLLRCKASAVWVIDVKPRFTFGESNLYRKTVNLSKYYNQDGNNNYFFKNSIR